MSGPAILAPFHQDERLPEDSIRLPDGLDVDLVDPVLPQGGQWGRLVELYRAVADTVTARLASDPARAPLAAGPGGARRCP